MDKNYPDSVDFTPLKSLHGEDGCNDYFNTPKFGGFNYLEEHMLFVSRLTDMGFNIKDAPYREGCQDNIFCAKKHGFVLRLSRIYGDDGKDFYRRFHGAMTAPIGWGKITDDFMMYLYPGEKLMLNDKELSDYWPYEGGDFYEYLLDQESNATDDVGARNMGFVEQYNGKKTPIIIDTDIVDLTGEELQKAKALFNDYATIGMKPADVYEQVLLDMTRDKTYHAIAIRHQELRQAFFKAWPGAHDGIMDFDRDKIQAFFNLAYDHVQQGRLHPSWKKPTRYEEKVKPPMGYGG